MGSIKSNNLKAEKAKAIYKHRMLRRIASLFRFVEVSVILVLILRLSIQLPIVVKNSSEYFRDFSIFLVNPRFVFLVGNAIIIMLLALSGQFSHQTSASSNSQPGFYEEFIQNSTKNLEKQSIKTEYGMKSQRIDEDQINNFPEKQMRNTEKRDGNYVEYEENQSAKQIIRTEDNNREKQSKKTEEANMSLEMKVYRRCQSGNLSCVMQSERSQPVLRRSETENNRKRDSYPEDGMSNEEFRRTIEAFIERQQKLRREEEHLIA
ncbi:uncharacterized protein G2W53_003278 [Senna tora]|uniref:DUF4408 domain-containing protein n=1 Tax=Senna tora TaxID=362788 RepID=A0A834XAA1_9FABA|nr:uncharacterized protein G2W53_003278 [Senna tora]